MVAAKPTVSSLFRMVREVDEAVEGRRRPARRHRAAAAQLLSIGIPPVPCRDPGAVGLSNRRPWPAVDSCGGRGTGRTPPGGQLSAPGAGTGMHERTGQPALEVDAAHRAGGRGRAEAGGVERRRSAGGDRAGCAFGRAKRWPPSSFASLARELSSDGLLPWWSALRRMSRSCANSNRRWARRDPQLVDLVGRTTVPTLAGVLTHVRALVANDSGVMHLGRGPWLPTAGLFGPTDERLTAPRSARAHAVLPCHPVWCRPCMLRECPLDHRCLRGISVSRRWWRRAGG